MLPMFEQLPTPVWVAIITGIFLVISKIIEKWDKAPGTPKHLENGRIDARIHTLRHMYGCSRVSVLGYHNGGYWIDNTSIDKITCKHESCGNTTKPLQMFMQGISASFLKEMPGILKEKGFLFEPDIELRRDRTGYNPAYYEVMREFGTTSTLAIAVKAKVFKWKKMRYEKELVFSVHLNWASPGPWPKGILTDSQIRLELCNHIQDIIHMVLPKHLKFYTLYDLLTTECVRLEESLDLHKGRLQ